MTALWRLPAYLELLHASGLRKSVGSHVGLRECGQGWTDNQIVTSLMMLNLAGGESVVDLEVLNKDAGFCRVLREVETYGMGRSERSTLKERCVSSDSVACRQSRWCSGTWRDSTTRTRRQSVKLTGRSYLHPTKRLRAWGR